MNSPERKSSVAAVVVTYNRLALLQECIAALRAQTRRPDEIIVVNNSSTDGTAEWLSTQSDLTVITQENLGSSGGQYAGIKTAYQKGHEWFWCMDDDTIAAPTALERLCATPYISNPKTGFLACLVTHEKGQAIPGGWFVPADAARWSQTVLSDRCVAVDMSTFVALMVSRNAVETVGLPMKSFFIMTDDWEFTTRISHQFSGYCVLDSLVVHKIQRPPTAYELRRSWKHLYTVRNEAAWIRAKKIPTRQKLKQLLWLLYGQIREVLSGLAPPKVILWYLKGLRLSIAIEYPNNSDQS